MASVVVAVAVVILIVVVTAVVVATAAVVVTVIVLAAVVAAVVAVDVASGFKISIFRHRNARSRNSFEFRCSTFQPANASTKLILQQLLAWRFAYL